MGFPFLCKRVVRWGRSREGEQPADHKAETVGFGEVQVVQHGQEQFPETRIREPRRPVVGQVGQVARLIAVEEGFIGQKKLVRANRDRPRHEGRLRHQYTSLPSAKSAASRKVSRPSRTCSSSLAISCWLAWHLHQGSGQNGFSSVWIW